MTQEQIAMVKQLREKTGAGMMDCKKALERYNWEEDMAIKYLHHYPHAIPMGFWASRKYIYCKHCDRFYIISKETKICNVCNSNFEC